MAEKPDRLVALKAAFVFNIARFTYWTDEERTKRDLTLCLTPPAAHYRPAFQALESKRKGDLELKIEILDSANSASECNILYLGGTQKGQPDEFVFAQPGILTVADENMDGSGSIIEFAVIDNRLRFSVDLDAANQAGLTMSSKLLTLAYKVRRNGLVHRGSSS